MSETDALETIKGTLGLLGYGSRAQNDLFETIRDQRMVVEQMVKFVGRGKDTPLKAIQRAVEELKPTVVLLGESEFPSTAYRKELSGTIDLLAKLKFSVLAIEWPHTDSAVLEKLGKDGNPEHLSQLFAEKSDRIKVRDGRTGKYVADAYYVNAISTAAKNDMRL